MVVVVEIEEEEEVVVEVIFLLWPRLDDDAMDETADEECCAETPRNETRELI